MRELLLDNLARNQSFDAALKKGDFVDQISGQYLQQIMFNKDAASRATAIKAMQVKIVQHFDKKVQPAARAIGVANAKAVLTATPPPPGGLENETYRKKVLYEGKMNARDRLRIVQANVNDRANTLENRLTAYWLEPGATPAQKLNTLRALHEKMDAEQKLYWKRLSAHMAGEGDRPRLPNLDFMARFNKDVKQDVRVQARRTGTQAETEHFEAAGHTLLSWVTVNAADACADCRRRQGLTGTTEFWDKTGRPGSGSTVCSVNCFCLLVPASTLDKNPELKQKGLETKAKPVVTPPETVKVLDERREEQKAAPAFPETHAEAKALRELGPLGGSTGAKLVEDTHGQKFVRKLGSSADHLREEYAAEQAYRAFGVPVPDSKLFEEAGERPIKLSKYVEGGKTVGQLKGEERQAAVAKAAKGLGADAILGNRDVAGLGVDNLLVSPAGDVFRIDTGGALRFRAQGRPKGDAFGDHPLELFTLRDKAVNADAASVFGGMSHDDAMASARNAVGRRKEVLAALPKDVQDVVGRRFDNLAHAVGTNDVLQADSWKQEYRGTFTETQMRLRASGFTDKLPKRLEQKGVSEKLVDENGKEWDDLRGAGGLSEKLLTFMNANGGDAALLSRWAIAQGSDSWSTVASGMKHAIAGYRDEPIDGLWWKWGLEKSRDHLAALAKQYGEAKIDKTIAALHAATYETLSAVEVPYLNRPAGTVSLIRTETKEIIQGLYNLQRGQKGVTMPRGAVESFSIVRPVMVYGTEVTVQDVPLHRVIGTYFFERSPAADAMFYKDSENEMIVMTSGIRFDYGRDAKRK